jgi:signal transduction histidine kinase
MREAVEAVEVLAAERRLSIVIDPDADLTVRTDPRRVCDVLVHLLSNAIKFTEKGGVRLGARRRADGARAMRFEVEDSGPGVPEDERGRIFQPFVQVDGTETRQFGGLGLGLAVCRKLARDLGGEVGCDGAPSGGALFWLDVPDVADQPAPAPKGPTAPAGRAGAIRGAEASGGFLTR